MSLGGSFINDVLVYPLRSPFPDCDLSLVVRRAARHRRSSPGKRGIAAENQEPAEKLLARPTLAAAVEAAAAPRYHRLPLAQLLLLTAESELLTPAGDPLVRAALPALDLALRSLAPQR